MSERLQHLVLVRHGQSEGDERRSAWRRGEAYQTNKTPEDELLTPKGEIESYHDGLWLKRDSILGRYALQGFDEYFVSAAYRSLQSAVAMDLPGAVWNLDPRLNERYRGLVRGLHPNQHKQRYPESYAQMKADPLNWRPPEGETFFDVADKQAAFFRDIQDYHSVIVVGHRDAMWAARKPIEGLSDQELAAVDTNAITNGYITYYTAINPFSELPEPALMWARSVDPMHPESDTGWQILPHVAERYGVNSMG